MSGSGDATRVKRNRKAKAAVLKEGEVEEMGADGRVGSKSDENESGDIEGHNGDASEDEFVVAVAGSSRKRKQEERKGDNEDEAAEEPNEGLDAIQNGCLDDRFKFVDELARKDFSLFTPDEIAILFTRWYRGCEKEAQEIIDKRISGRWICDNIRGGQFVDWIVDSFVIPCKTSFVVAQRIFDFIRSKICGGGNPANDSEAVYADLTLCEVYASEFEGLQFTMGSFMRAVKARGVDQEAVGEVGGKGQRAKVLSEVDQQRQSQIAHYERSQARKSASQAKSVVSINPSESHSVDRDGTADKKSKFGNQFGDDFVSEEFLPEVSKSDASKKCKAPAVSWPCLTRMDYKAFAEFFKKYKKCVEEGNDSAQFRSLRSCIDIDLRDTVRRKLKVNFEEYRKLDDGQVTLRLFRYFGPIDYDSAVKFLEGSEMSSHSDDVDSQSLFMAKFDRHVKEFSLRINVVKACMMEVQGCKAVSETFKDLTKVKVMQIYEDSFRVLKDKSCQAMKCFTYVKDFKKTKTFDDINSHLNDEFDEKDRAVKDGHFRYTTEPKAKSGSGGGTVGQKNGGGGNVKDAAKRTDQKARKVVKGCDRGQACGSETNHHGAGCNLKTCVIFDTKYAVPKNFVWPDSDKKERIDPGRDVWVELNKARPEVAKYNVHLREEKLKVWAKENEEKKKNFAGGGDKGKKRSSGGDDNSADKKVKLSNYSSVSADFFGWDSDVDMSRLGIGSQFFAECSFDKEDSYFKVLLDSGAGLNAIHEDMLKEVNVLDTRSVNLIVSNLGENFCETQSAVQLKFSLTDIDGKPIEYTEWFCVWNVSQHMLVLGREFLRINKFTTFDDRLRKWSVKEKKCEVEECLDRAFIDSVKQSSKHPIQRYQFYRPPKEREFIELIMRRMLWVLRHALRGVQCVLQNA
jgi:hypothetical protein